MIITEKEINILFSNINYRILDAKIHKINIYKNEILNIEISYTPFNSFKKSTLLLQDVSNFNLNWDNKVEFYNVESCKILFVNNQFYLSLDPYDENILEYDTRDNDVIICSKIEIFVE